MLSLGASVLRPCPSISSLSRPLHRGPRVSKLLTARTLRTGGGNEETNDFSSGGRLGIGTTRLGRLLRDRGKDLANRFREIRRNLPLKVFLVLLGFYSANALATVLGQTGDWDVLVAAIMVALTEGIGFLMYRLKSLGERLSFVVAMINYWKAGLSFGLFVDAFKLGS